MFRPRSYGKTPLPFLGRMEAAQGFARLPGFSPAAKAGRLAAAVGNRRKLRLADKGAVAMRDVVHWGAGASVGF